jgi:quinoprotein glucose dehydrogenase
MLCRLFAATAVVVCGLALASQDPPYNPKVFGPSDEGKKALKRIRVPAGTEVTLYAAEPLLANPVCFCFDEQGNLYVAETFRLGAGVTDNRNHLKKPNWLEDELACRTVADRVAMYKKHLGKTFDTYDKDHDRIRKLIDTDGDGLPDKAIVFSDGYNTHASGIGAGLVARQGKVWYTCIPDLWVLQDTKGTHQADVKKSLHTGYGVHTAYIGHDMHGLKIGPDGRLYFSIGDRGLQVETNGKVVSNPDSGAVLRCDLDGSNLEIVATGLRNPQELGFDQYGNLFTGDNNADAGDAARWVQIIDGGDSGWRIGYQEMNIPMRLGPWNSEKMWHLPHDGQPAHLVPPCGHIANGPSGVTYHPGVTQLPDRYKEHFFLVDFRGDAGKSGIYAFKLKPRGASFQVDGKPEEFVWSVLATDCDFGPDGGFYLSDWVTGWGKTGKGRIYRVADPSKAKDPVVLEVKQLIAEGMAKRKADELYKLLDHADMRVRQEAQFELVQRKDATTLLDATRNLKKLGRLHGIWGLGQLYRTERPKAPVFAQLAAYLGTSDVDVSCQAIKVLGECKAVEHFRDLVNQLKAKEPRNRFEAALALSRLGKVDAVPPVVEMLRDNADKDPYLRHAGVMALTRLGGKEELVSIARDPAPAVRLAALLAMRRRGMAEVGRFLDDAEPRLVVEAARAIYDQPVPAALPQLAALITRSGLSDPLWYRVVNANFRLGKAANAQALAKFAGRKDVPEALRVEALVCLGQWAAPSGRDRIVGLWRPMQARPVEEAREALSVNAAALFAGPDKVRSEAAKLAAKVGLKDMGPVLLAIASDVKRPAALRVETLKALAALKDSRLEAAMKMALADNDPRVRTEGRRILAVLDPDAIIDELNRALSKGDTLDRQGAFAILGDLDVRGTTALLEYWLSQVVEGGEVEKEVYLDLLEASAKHPVPVIAKLLDKYEASRSPKDPLAKWTEALHGGDAENGRRIFFERSEVSCLRCHKVQGVGGEVGPDLTGIGGKQKREYLLESIVDPDKQIAKGYETVVLTLTNGQVKTGILKSEDKKEVRLMTPEGTVIVVPVAQIDTRSRGPSAMPADLMKHLSRRELRDLVEFLSSLK